MLNFLNLILLIARSFSFKSNVGAGRSNIIKLHFVILMPSQQSAFRIGHLLGRVNNSSF